MINVRPLTIHRRRSCSHQKEHLFDRMHTCSRKLRPVKRDPALVQARCPPEGGLQFTSFLKIGNIANGSNDGGRLDEPNRRNGEQNLSLTRGGHKSGDLGMQEFQGVLNQP